MLELLSWLWGQAGKVFAWFGWPFWDFYQRLTNFFSILLSTIQQNLRPVYGTIWQGLGDLWNRTTGFVGGVINNVSTYANNLFGIVRNEVNNVGTRVEMYRAQGKSYVDAVILALRDTMLAIFNSFIGQTQLLWMSIWKEWQQYQNFLGKWVLSMIDITIIPIRNWLNQQLAAVNEFVGRIEATIIALRTSVSFVTGNVQRTVTAFTSDPVGFSLALIVPRLLEVLFQLLAEGLGAEHDVIPPRGDWTTTSTVRGDNPPVAPPVAAGGLVHPLATIRVSGYRFGPSHPGVDLGLVMGQPVYAMHAGIVQQAGWNITGYGNNVVLAGGDWWTRYAHLQAVTVNVGQRIEPGTLVGYGDSTGNSTGPHLHLEVKYRGQFVDPLTVL